MEASALLDAHVQLKRIYTALSEALDLTRQLADAVDRDDRVAIQLLVSMRQEPTDKLAGAQQALEQQKKSLPPEDGRRLDGLLRGAEAASGQVGANQRLLRQLVDMDRVVNRKLAREKTVYQ